MPQFHDPDQEAAYILGLPVPATYTRPGTPQMMGGAHEAASQFDRTLATWAPPIQSADADILPDKAMMDARAIDITRNDAFALAGVNLHRDNIVGSQFMLNSKPKIKALGMDELHTAFVPLVLAVPVILGATILLLKKQEA